MAQEKPWRPADYPPLALYAPLQTVCVPPQMRENWGYETRPDHRTAEPARADLGRRERSRRGLTGTAWKILAWAFACAVVASIVALVVAVLVLHVR